MTEHRQLLALLQVYAGNSLRISGLAKINKKDKVAEAENSKIMQQLPEELKPHMIEATNVIDRLCQTIADVDFIGFGVVIDLLDQAKKGQVLQVEKEDYEALARQDINS
jgi:hypothetical protein